MLTSFVDGAISSMTDGAGDCPGVESMGAAFSLTDGVGGGAGSMASFAGSAGFSMDGEEGSTVEE